MLQDVVHVPVTLLTAPHVPASAKLIWMVSRLRPKSDEAGSSGAPGMSPPPSIAGSPAVHRAPNTAWLSATAGLARTTVLTGISQLRAAGWHPGAAAGPGATVSVPAELLINWQIGIHARVLYGLLLLTPGFQHPGGRITFEQLTALAHASRNTVAKALDQLTRAEWIKVERANRLAPIHFELTFPGLDRGMTALARAQRRLAKRNPFGEALMREYLTLLVDSDEYEDNAAPGFLINPRTDERLEFDRFYPPTVAFEFNGAQHDRATEKIPLEASVAQRERDYIKLGICVTRGITLVIVHAEDLTLKQMRQKVTDLLPLRDLTGYDVLIEYLEAESRVYRRRVAKL